ncbi:MAG: cytidylate kinase family protein [Candidatus Woesearchaeota archaeon]
MIISINGDPGSGKSTVAEILANRFHLKNIYIGQIMRDLAKKKGITLEELGKICEKDPKIDRETDKYIEDLGKEKDDFIIQSRTAYHFIPQSIKIFLEVEPQEGARRILQDLKSERGKHRNEGKRLNTIKDVEKSIQERMKSEKKRFKEYHSLDHHDRNSFDIVIDTTNTPAEEVAERIIEFVEKRK